MASLLTNSALLDSLILLVTLLYILYKYVTRNFNYWDKRGVQSIKPKAFFGNFQDVVYMKVSIGKFMADLYNQTKGDFFGIWVFGTPHLVIRSPEVVKHILVKDFNYFNDRTIANDENADPMASQVLFMLQNPQWKAMRARLTPIFTAGKIRNMLPLMNEASEDLIDYLTKNCVGGDALEAKEICAKFTTDLISSCAFGIKAESFQHEHADFREIGRTMFDFKISNALRVTSYFFAPTLVSLFKLKFFSPSVYTFLRSAFWETIKEREQTGIKRNDLIDIIIEMKAQNISDGINFEGDRVVAQAVQFFAAGFETTSSTIAFSLYEMCLDTKIQLRVRKEINKALEDHGGCTYEAIQSMTYLQQVISEVLRKYPVLPFLDRRCVKEYQLPNSNVVIEKGTPVYIPLMALHFDPQHFPEPDTFNPERFSKENIGKIPPYAYIPFGSGPHNCIGERFGLIASKLGIIQILSNFEVAQTDETPVPIIFDPKSFILQSTVGLPMRFTQYNRHMSAAT